MRRKSGQKEIVATPILLEQGYTDYAVIQDFPLSGRPVFLHPRKNKWLNKLTGEIFSYDLELPNEDGTRLSAEFVAFLKGDGRDNGTVD